MKRKLKTINFYKENKPWDFKEYEISVLNLIFEKIKFFFSDLG